MNDIWNFNSASMCFEVSHANIEINYHFATLYCDPYPTLSLH